MDELLIKVQEGYESIITDREADAERAEHFAAFCIVVLGGTLVCALVAFIAQAMLG